MKNTEDFDKELDREIDEIWREIKEDTDRQGSSERGGVGQTERETDPELEALMDEICREEGIDEEAERFAEEICSVPGKNRKKRFTVISGGKKGQTCSTQK